jgi:hypothetical protein
MKMGMSDYGNIADGLMSVMAAAMKHPARPNEVEFEVWRA